MYGTLMTDINSTKLSDEDIALINHPQIGGIILFSRNVKSPSQVRRLCDCIRSHKKDIIIGVDQEGGRVARLRQGFTPLPAMGNLGEYFKSHPSKALKLAYDCGYLMAAEVLAVGIDISFAPVLDINGVSKVIGDRSFDTNVFNITALATQFMHGMHKAGMATTGKHFPGHGSLEPDSHLSTAIDERTFDKIKQLDLQPFEQTMPWLDALMPAHVIYSKIDDKPAGFSKIWLKDILRKQLKFDGVIFSDDLSMQGAKVAGDITDRVRIAIEAGCDMTLVCNDRIAINKVLSKADQIPYPNQKRLQTMASDIPKWQGDFNKTCQQFDYYQHAKRHVLEIFAKNHSNTISKVDPTYYN